MIIGTDLKNPPSEDVVYQALSNFETMLLVHLPSINREEIQRDLEAILTRTFDGKKYIELFQGLNQKSEREQFKFLGKNYCKEESIRQFLQSYEDSPSPLQ